MLQQWHILYWRVKCLLLTVTCFHYKGLKFVGVIFGDASHSLLRWNSFIHMCICTWSKCDGHPFCPGKKYFIAIFFFIYECWNWTNWKVTSILVNDIEQHLNLRNLTLLFNGPQSQKKNHFFEPIRANSKPPSQMQVGWSDADVEGPWEGETRKLTYRRRRAARLDPRSTFPLTWLDELSTSRSLVVPLVCIGTDLNWLWAGSTSVVIQKWKNQHGDVFFSFFK